MTSSEKIEELLAVMRALRDPQTGCPWDVEQTFESIASYTIEEAYEVADAIRRGDMAELKRELGDLLLQVVYHARIAEEADEFGFEDVVEAITRKMINRHPHVFGTPEERARGIQPGDWDRIKAAEKAELHAERADQAASQSLLDEVPAVLPGLTRAVKLQKAAGRVGFDWNDPFAVLEKITEEVDEVKAELKASGDRQDALEDEVGDVLFAVANLARHLRIEPEAALERANEKFRRRFGVIERTLADRGQSFDDVTLDEMESIWRRAKDIEKQNT